MFARRSVAVFWRHMMSKGNFSFVAWMLATFLVAAAVTIVLSHDPVAAGPDEDGKTSGTGEYQTSGE